MDEQASISRRQLPRGGIVIRSHDGPEGQVFPYIYTPYSVLVTLFPVVVDWPLLQVYQSAGGNVVRSARMPLLNSRGYAREKLSIRESDRYSSPLTLGPTRPSVGRTHHYRTLTYPIRRCRTKMAFRTNLLRPRQASPISTYTRHRLRSFSGFRLLNTLI